MANVDKEIRKGKAYYRVCFFDGNKKRKRIRLVGDSNNKKDAQAIASRVTELNACRISGRPMESALAKWVASLGQELSQKLAQAGLIEARQQTTLTVFLKTYIDARRSEVEARTIGNFEATQKKLIDHFGDIDLRAIDAGKAHDWKQALFAEVGAVTVAGHVKRAKQFFRYAKLKQFIDANPFDGLVAGSQANHSRKAFIKREVIDKVIEHAPDAEWRLLIALARYGGLRNPSETLRLKWSDINWAEKRIVVTCKKTRRTKPVRIIPLFPELERYLIEASEQAQEGAAYCIERYRSQGVNLRTGLERIIKKAGQEPWQRLWQNLRASRETELANEYPIQVVTDWIGNSPEVAQRHYLQTTDEHYAQAVAQGGARGGAVVGQMVGQQPSAATDDKRKKPQPTPRETANANEKATVADESKSGSSTPGRIRTYNPRFRRPMRYPVAPRARGAAL